MKLGLAVSLMVTLLPSLMLGYTNGLTVLGAVGAFAFGAVIYRRKAAE